jgi:tetratricopeptide (TPR) repeat protein
LRALREGSLSAADTTLNDAAIDVLHAACRLVQEQESSDSEDPLRDARNLYDFVERAVWPEPNFEERDEVLADVAFSGWRVALIRGTAHDAEGWRRRFLSAARSVSTLQIAVGDLLTTSSQQRLEKLTPSLPQGSQILLYASDVLLQRNEADPKRVADHSALLYESLTELEHEFLRSDESHYFLGLFAMIAGTANRMLFRREEARRWFHRAESNFSLIRNGAAQIARLAYQRLALKIEERQFDEVLRQALRCGDVFMQLELVDDAVKCQFLYGIALVETLRVREAVLIFENICRTLDPNRNLKLLAEATGNLAQYHLLLGNPVEALTHAQRALPLLQRSDDRVGLAKLRWLTANIIREQGNLVEAAEAYRAALTACDQIGIRNDSASIRLALAEILLDLGRSEEAEREIRAALPIIEEEKMVPEGYAALALLQESLRRRKIDRQALRNLHGYFQDEKS